MKKFLTFILGICLIIPCAFLFAGCKEETETKMETWDGTSVEVSVADNNGVILIETAEELSGFAKAVNAGNSFAGKTIRLACDMNMLGRTWTPIGLGNRNVLGEETNAFSGTFDGNGKKIIGLNSEGYTPALEHQHHETDFATTVQTYHYGLFGVAINATIKNLTVSVDFDCEDDTLKGDSVGGLVGFASEGLTIENCIVNGSIEGYDAVGGLVGRSYGSSTTNPVVIINCVNNAEVEALYKAAGIVGYIKSENLDATIDRCVNNGEIEVEGVNRKNVDFVSMVAGIANYSWATGYVNKIIVTNNINKATLEACSQLSNSLTNWHSYAYIANSVGQGFEGTNHSYNFEGNTNEASIYYNEVKVDNANCVMVLRSQTYPIYTYLNEFNGDSYTAPTPAE